MPLTSNPVEFRIRATGEVVTERELRVRLENISLPQVIGADACEVAGVDPVMAAPAPATTATQTAVRSGVVQDAKGNWVHAWTIRNWTAEEIAADNAAKAEAARIAAIEQEIKDDTVLSNIKGMTKAQYDAWWSANITNLAQLNGAVKRIVRVVARRNL